MNQLTITFASKTDLDTLLKQVATARQRRGKGSHLGIAGMEAMTKALERSWIEEGSPTLESIRNDCADYLDDKTDLTGHELIEAIYNTTISALEPTTKKKV